MQSSAVTVKLPSIEEVANEYSIHSTKLTDHFRSSPPKALSNSSPSFLGAMDGNSAARVSGVTLSSKLWFGCACESRCDALLGCRSFSSRSSQPGATRRFSARSRADIDSCQSLIALSPSVFVLFRCCSRALHEARMSSGDAACSPLAEMT